MNIRIIMADDHAIVREGIRNIIDRKAKDIAIIGEASNGREVLTLAKNNPPDVYVLDIAMPILNGLETIDRLIKMNPNNKIVILSMHDERNLVEKAFRYGSKGYVLKESIAEELIDAIREVYMDRYYLSPKISKFIIQGFLGKRSDQVQDKSVRNLTRREREIIQLIAEGFTSKEIAKALNISLNTAHIHKNNIMQKLDIHKQADLIRYALKEGFSSL